MSAPGYDPMTLARFAAKPGSDRVMEIYIRMPDVLVEKWVHDGLFLINTVNMPPPTHPDDPLRVALAAEAAGEAAPPTPGQTSPALEGPERRRLPSAALSVEEQVVNLRMQGDDATAIAHKLDIDIERASTILKEAREQGGLQFPAKGKQKSRDALKKVNFHIEMKFIPMGVRSKLAQVAVRYGMSVEQLVAARKLFVEMRRDKRTLEDIAKATRVPEKDLLTWLYKARSGGFPDLPLDVGYQDANARPVLPIRPANAPIRLKSYAACEAAKMTGAMGKMRTAAKSRGLSMADYEYMREVIVDMGLEGRRPIDIANAVGERPTFVKGVLDYAEREGVMLPVAGPPLSEQIPVAGGIVERALLATIKPWDEIPKSAKPVILRAAQARKITPAVYLARRETAIRMRLNGASKAQIAEATQENGNAVFSWLREAERTSGVKFPLSEVRDAPPQTLAAE